MRRDNARNKCVIIHSHIIASCFNSNNEPKAACANRSRSRSALVLPLCNGIIRSFLAVNRWFFFIYVQSSRARCESTVSYMTKPMTNIVFSKQCYAYCMLLQAIYSQCYRWDKLDIIKDIRTIRSFQTNYSLLSAQRLEANPQFSILCLFVYVPNNSLTRTRGPHEWLTNRFILFPEKYSRSSNCPWTIRCLLYRTFLNMSKSRMWPIKKQSIYLISSHRLFQSPYYGNLRLKISNKKII